MMICLFPCSHTRFWNEFPDAVCFFLCVLIATLQKDSTLRECMSSGTSATTSVTSDETSESTVTSTSCSGTTSRTDATTTGCWLSRRHRRRPSADSSPCRGTGSSSRTLKLSVLETITAAETLSQIVTDGQSLASKARERAERLAARFTRCHVPVAGLSPSMEQHDGIASWVAGLMTLQELTVARLQAPGSADDARQCESLDAALAFASDVGLWIASSLSRRFLKTDATVSDAEARRIRTPPVTFNEMTEAIREAMQGAAAAPGKTPSPHRPPLPDSMTAWRNLVGHLLAFSAMCSDAENGAHRIAVHGCLLPRGALAVRAEDEDAPPPADGQPPRPPLPARFRTLWSGTRHLLEHVLCRNGDCKSALRFVTSPPPIGASSFDVADTDVSSPEVVVQLRLRVAAVTAMESELLLLSQRWLQRRKRQRKLEKAIEVLPVRRPPGDFPRSVKLASASEDTFSGDIGFSRLHDRLFIDVNDAESRCTTMLADAARLQNAMDQCTETLRTALRTATNAARRLFALHSEAVLVERCAAESQAELRRTWLPAVASASRIVDLSLCVAALYYPGRGSGNTAAAHRNDRDGD